MLRTNEPSVNVLYNVMNNDPNEMLHVFDLQYLKNV